ncbi:MAG: Dam family site-specific DNA-(adenine-N6)-methyltransferase [Crinalium sp.]
MTNQQVEKQARYRVSPLKWAGGKSWLVPKMKEIWQSHSDRRWVDPFCGALSLPLSLRPTDALLGDICFDLINFWQMVREDLVIRPEILVNQAEAFYERRAEFNSLPLDQTVKRAELFYYLLRSCHSGLCRFNGKGEFNSPYGNYKTDSIYQTDFSSYRSIIQHWKFRCQDAEKTCALTKPGDFLFLDPPYWGTFTGYAGNKFGWDEQMITAQLAHAHQGPVVCCNSAAPEIVTLYKEKGFEIKILTTAYKMNTKGLRPQAQEMFAFKNI